MFELVADAQQVSPTAASALVAYVNIALSKVTPPLIQTALGKFSHRGLLSTMACKGVTAAILLGFKRKIIEAARKVDRGIINMIANKSWVELKILVPYDSYQHLEGLLDLCEQIEAENDGVMILAFSIKRVRVKKVIKDH